MLLCHVVLVAILLVGNGVAWGDAEWTLAIRDVSLFDVTTGKMLPHRTLLIRSDRIQAIGTPDRPIAIPAGDGRRCGAAAAFYLSRDPACRVVSNSQFRLPFPGDRRLRFSVLPNVGEQSHLCLFGKSPRDIRQLDESGRGRLQLSNQRSVDRHDGRRPSSGGDH